MKCVACEDKPTGANDPCAVCGQSCNSKIVIKDMTQLAQVTKVCNAMVDLIGTDEMHPLYNTMLGIMDAIGDYEDIHIAPLLEQDKTSRPDHASARGTTDVQT